MSPTAPKAIVDALGNLSDAIVLEIGPGKGAITRLLADRGATLIAVELDRTLAASLEEEFSHHGRTNVEILQQDILSVDLGRLLSDRFPPGSPNPSGLVVVGNLPYYITSDILLHLFAHHRTIDRAVLMVQREVADRILATPGTRDYGALSATAQMHAHVENLFTLPPGAFSPPPEVYSTVFRITMRPRFAELGVDRELFLRFLRDAFAQKRKTLANNLRAAGYSAEQIQRALSSCRIEPLTRAEALPLDAMACLFQALVQRA